MISEATAAVVSARLMSADWALKSEVMGAAVLAENDEHFWQLLGVATPDIVKVGPKGYIHGWVFVGSSGTGARVRHPQHGSGTVTAHDGRRARVRFSRPDSEHTFEAREGTTKGKFVSREDHAKTLADRVTRDPKTARDLSDSELKDTDDEFIRRAIALGRNGQFSKAHRAIRTEATQRARVSMAHRERMIERMPRAETVVSALEARARETGKHRAIHQAVGAHRDLAIRARAVGLNDVADKHDSMARKLLDDAAHNTLQSRGPSRAEQAPDDLSKRADRTGERADHVAASVAQHKAGNPERAAEHRSAVRSIDTSNRHSSAAKKHAAAAERTDDPALHRAAATSYRNAAEHMADVPGGEKAAADLRGQADEHDNIAQRIIHATANYVKSFLHANRTGHKADKKGTADAHRAAADAENEAAARAITEPQRRHHAAEAARHVKAAEALDAKTSVSAA